MKEQFSEIALLPGGVGGGCAVTGAGGVRLGLWLWAGRLADGAGRRLCRAGRMICGGWHPGGAVAADDPRRMLGGSGWRRGGMVERARMYGACVRRDTPPPMQGTPAATKGSAPSEKGFPSPNFFYRRRFPRRIFFKPIPADFPPKACAGFVLAGGHSRKLLPQGCLYEPMGCVKRDRRYPAGCMSRRCSVSCGTTVRSMALSPAEMGRQRRFGAVAVTGVLA